MITAAPARSHEPSGLSVKGLVIFVLVFLGTLIVMHIGVASVYLTLSAGRPTPGATVDTREEMMIQGWVHPAQELLVVRGAAREHLSGYGWVDRAHGIVRIPIERAMRLIVNERGGAQPGASPEPRSESEEQR